MNTNIAEDQKKIHKNNDSSPYAKDMKDRWDLLKEKKEKLGYGDLTFKEFTDLKPDINGGQSEAGQLLEAQEMVANLIDVEKEIVKGSKSNDDLIKIINEEKNTESLKRVCRRISNLRKTGSLVESDQLIKKLKDAAKTIDVTAKTVDSLLNEETSSKSKNIQAVDLPFHVLGFNSQRKVLIWFNGHVMHIPILSLSSELELLWGLPPEQINVVKSEMREKGIIDEEMPIKVGIWRLPEWKEEEKTLIVSGRGGVFLQKGKFTPLKGPVVDEQIVQFERKHWIDLEALQTCSADLKLTFNQIRDILSEWPWISPDMADWMTAFVMLMPFQQLMSWRPWLWLDGASNSGKSAFFDEFLEQLYGSLIKRADKATAHSLMQATGNSGKIPVLDEFEKYKHNDELLNCCKLMNRGGIKTTGTTGQNELSFHLHHMPIFGSIYLPRTLITDQSQRNRIVRFSLGKVLKPKRVIASNEMQRLGLNSIAAVLSSWGEIESIASQIASETPQIVEDFEGELSSRSVENFKYAAAILRIVTGEEQAVPAWARQEQVDDGRTIIEAIIRQKIRDSKGCEHLVQDLIESACGEPGEFNATQDQAHDILRLHGLRIVESKKGTKNLALRTDMVSSEILKGDDDFKGLDLTEPLRRIPGAETKRTSWGKGSGTKPYAVQVPIECVLPDENVSSSGKKGASDE